MTRRLASPRADNPRESRVEGGEGEEGVLYKSPVQFGRGLYKGVNVRILGGEHHWGPSWGLAGMDQVYVNCY